MLVPPYLVALLLLTFAVCVFALWKGGPAERIGALCILANHAVSIAAESMIYRFGGTMGQLVLDGLTALALLVVALRYASPWVGTVMLLYGGQFALHSFYFVTERPHDRLHIILNNLDFLAITLCLAAGAALTLRRRKLPAAA